MEEDHAFNNWDLQAVVRSCRSTPPPPPPPLAPVLSEPVFIPPAPLPAMAHAVLKEEVSRDYNNNPNWCFPDLMAAPSGLQELEELCKSFYPKSPLGGCGATVSETLVVGPAINQPGLLPPPPPPPFLVQKIKPSRLQIPRSKRRKNQPKKVVRTVPADGGSSDMWAWRKYGQKPIKGSPYPRGYYRCSSSKGCLARKQVERSCTDPSMLIITYTAEHNHPLPTHRNSLAGSTRQKCLPVASTTTTTTTSSSSTTGSGGEDNSPLTGLSPNTPLTASLDEEEEEEEGMLLVEDLEVMREDEFLILGKGGEGTGDVPFERIGEDFSELLDDLCFNPPWSVNSGNDSAALAGDSAS